MDIKRLNRKEAVNLRTIISVLDIPDNAVYYTDTSTEFGRYGVRYSILFDKDYNVIEYVNVRYSNAVENLTHIVHEDDNIAYKSAKMVYHLSDRNDKGFWKVNMIRY
jgi:hypothetical protein